MRSRRSPPALPGRALGTLCARSLSSALMVGTLSARPLPAHAATCRGASPNAPRPGVLPAGSARLGAQARGAPRDAPAVAATVIGTLGRSLEQHQHGARMDLVVVVRGAQSLAGALVHLVKLVAQAVERGRDLAESLLVHGQRLAGEMGVGAIETADRGGLGDDVPDGSKRRVDERLLHDSRHLAPRVVADADPSLRLVVVLDRAAARLLAGDLDQAEVVEDAHVVADVPARGVQRVRGLARAGLAGLA